MHKSILKYLLPGFSLILIGGVFIFKFHSLSAPQDLSFIVSRLSAIETQLNSLQQELKKPSTSVDINKLASSIELIKNKDVSTLNQLMSENRTQLLQKLDILNEMVKDINNKQHPIRYLPVTALPFKVISIDSIQQVSVATVTYHFKTIPLEKNDKLAGWSVLNIEFGKQRMELANHNKEHVIINMTTVQGESNA